MQMKTRAVNESGMNYSTREFSNLYEGHENTNVENPWYWIVLPGSSYNLNITYSWNGYNLVRMYERKGLYIVKVTSGNMHKKVVGK